MREGCSAVPPLLVTSPLFAAITLLVAVVVVVVVVCGEIVPSVVVMVVWLWRPVRACGSSIGSKCVVAPGITTTTTTATTTTTTPSFTLRTELAVISLSNTHHCLRLCVTCRALPGRPIAPGACWGAGWRVLGRG
ncbi:hypothetical protein E2C01_090084 [Portunus trituberculatus]|uniref:Uncharacterized protein n=1 Tax=Portunus trituberculatus TaxID=210409 RepID=A0A5B7JR99_PORTR|nr:hypothetical protein [Portunus trituberculatus]